MYLWNWEPNEAKQESNALMEANRDDEDAMQDFNQRLSLADAFILHALGVTLMVSQHMLTL